MYEWLVAQVGVGGALGLAFGSWVVLFLVVIAGLVWQIYRFKKAYALTDTSGMVLHESEQINIAPSDEDEIRGDNLPRRLTLCDSVIIDNERRIVLVRRDDVEHLIMIGGAGDMIIEHNIPVEVPSMDPVSMLAIAQVEAEALINESIINEKEQTQPPIEDDAPLEDTASAISDEEIRTKSQDQDQEIMEEKNEDFSVPPLPVHESLVDEKIEQTDSTMASLFPGHMVDPATSDQRNEQDQPDNSLQEPPVASYFAGQPKQVEPATQPQNDTTGHSTIAPSPLAPIAQQEKASIADQQSMQPRILPLNPFFHASSPLKKPDNPPPATPVMTPPQPQAHTSSPPQKTPENQISAAKAPPPAASRLEPQSLFINSFLGFPLQQLTKTDTTASPPTPPLVQTYGKPASPVILKKSNS